MQTEDEKIKYTMKERRIVLEKTKKGADRRFPLFPEPLLLTPSLFHSIEKASVCLPISVCMCLNCVLIKAVC